MFVFGLGFNWAGFYLYELTVMGLYHKSLSSIFSNNKLITKSEFRNIPSLITFFETTYDIFNYLINNEIFVCFMWIKEIFERVRVVKIPGMWITCSACEHFSTCEYIFDKLNLGIFYIFNMFVFQHVTLQRPIRFIIVCNFWKTFLGICITHQFQEIRVICK